MHGFIRFIKSSRLLTVGAIAFIITLAAALAAFRGSRSGLVVAFSLAAANVRDDIRRLGWSIDEAGQSGEK